MCLRAAGSCTLNKSKWNARRASSLTPARSIVAPSLSHHPRCKLGPRRHCKLASAIAKIGLTMKATRMLAHAKTLIRPAQAQLVDLTTRRTTGQAIASPVRIVWPSADDMENKVVTAKRHMLNRLHGRRLIDDFVNKAEVVVLYQDDRCESKPLLDQHFTISQQ